MSMQIDALWDECTTDDDIQTALENLPRSLDETYARCLQRIDRRQSRFAQTILRWVAATTTPFQVDQLREALAIHPNTGCLDRNRMPPRQEIVKCCCNLITSNNGQILLAHHSVRQFLETRLPSGRFTWASYKLHTAQLELGALCVNHLTSADYGLNLQHYNLGECSRIAIGKPTMKTLIEGPLPSWTHRLLLRPKPATMFLPSKASSPPSDMELSSFFHYAKAHWAPLTRNITKASPHWDNFRRLALEPNLSWRLHPWPPLGESLNSHYFGLLGWAIVHYHVPLLDLLLGIQDFKPRDGIFNMPFYQYDNLPALHLASRAGNTEIIKRLLEVCNPNKKDNNHQTGLHHAAETGRVDVSLLLIQRQASLKAQDNRGRTALHSAAERGHVSVVQALIDGGADINQKDYMGRTALFLAAGNGHETVVRMLFGQGADLNMEDNNRLTPLFMAADNLQDQTIRTLIELRGDINMQDGVGRKVLNIIAMKLSEDEGSKLNANQAVFLAVKQGHEAVLKVLLACGVDINEKDSDGRTPLLQAAASGNEVMAKLLLEKGANIEGRDREFGWTPLSWAVEEGQEAVVQLLLDKGADIEAQHNWNGRTPLSWAVEKGQESIIRLLLKKGANIEAMNWDGRTPLSRAAQGGHVAVAKLLLEKGANTETRDTEYGCTPLSWAVEKEQEAIIKLLLDRGADVKAKDGSGQTPLSQAVKKGNRAVSKLLLEKGAHVEAEDWDKRTPLLWAAKGGQEAIAKLLLEKGADIEAKDKDNRTPLSLAAGMGHETVCKLLLEEGADTEVEDNSGQTPLLWAVDIGHEAVTKLLLEKVADTEVEQ